MRRSIILGVALATFLVHATAGAGDSYSVGRLTVEHPWARATAGAAKTGVVYLTIRNDGSADDRLIAVAAGSVAGQAMLHTNIMEGNVMKMRSVESIAVKAGQSISLKPGGDHIMLMGLKAPLRKGQRFPLTLRFAKAGAVTVEIEIEAIGAMGEGHGKHGQ